MLVKTIWFTLLFIILNKVGSRGKFGMLIITFFMILKSWLWLKFWFNYMFFGLQVSILLMLGTSLGTFSFWRYTKFKFCKKKKKNVIDTRNGIVFSADCQIISIIYTLNADYCCQLSSFLESYLTLWYGEYLKLFHKFNCRRQIVVDLISIDSPAWRGSQNG